MTQLQTNSGHRFAVLDDYIDVSRAREAIDWIPGTAWKRYDSPFEAKWTLADKAAIDAEPDLSVLFAQLEEVTILQAAELFGVDLLPDGQRHYAGVFRYAPGDHLGVHVDAGIHPASGLRKHVTAVLYFGGDGPLELWNGTTCASNRVISRPSASAIGQYEPLGVVSDAGVHDLAEAIAPDAGRLVLFENNDYAWHGTPVNTGDTDRIVATVSYLSASINDFENKRQRAFFVPRPSENWDAETYALRDLRADSERFAEAYRA